jgi:hypothetical protein
VSLDDFLGDGWPPPQFVKVDVEGGAAQVLAGAIRLLQDIRPEMYVELHGPEEQAGLRNLVQKHDYVLQTLSGDVIGDPTDGWHNPIWCKPAA